MTHAKKYFVLLLLTLCCTVPLLGADSSSSPVSYQHIIRHDPNFSIHLVTIDLTSPKVSLHVCRAGPQPKDAHWVTTLLPPSEIAAREGYDIAINGDFFEADKTVDTEGKKSGYVKGKLAAPEGPAITDGKLWFTNSTTRPALEIDRHDHIIITTVKSHEHLAKSIKQAVGGNPIILVDGKKTVPSGRFATARHPRTAVGVSQDGTKMVLLVVDGRQPDLSIGMTLSDVADEMLKAGCYNAINLDGGGSSVLVMRDPATDKLRVMNSPSDTRERAVADVLCVKVKGPMPALP
jgi:exopolysaccharide biosynthesis protein